MNKQVILMAFASANSVMTYPITKTGPQFLDNGLLLDRSSVNQLLLNRISTAMRE
ncbi:hypothetical protein HanRHA438_Chr01g0011251 [Helianthus annuus]|nr:hypothetical protein HanRHA438_Chr01g0011251 [Helianthus annuus]